MVDGYEALVQENVSLEERVRDTRVSEIRLEKAMEKLKEENEALIRRERQLENENRNLTDILNNIREENNLLRAQVHVPRSNHAEMQIPSSTPLPKPPNEGTRERVTPPMSDVETQTDAATSFPDSAAESQKDCTRVTRATSVGCRCTRDASKDFRRGDSGDVCLARDL